MIAPGTAAGIFTTVGLEAQAVRNTSGMINKSFMAFGVERLNAVVERLPGQKCRHPSQSIDDGFLLRLRRRGQLFG
jgi:hypothetical protein